MWSVRMAIICIECAVYKRVLFACSMVLYTNEHNVYIYMHFTKGYDLYALYTDK